MPMQRWMQSAAGGTSQRLNPAVAMMRSLSRIPGAAPVAPRAIVSPIAVIAFLPRKVLLRERGGGAIDESRWVFLWTDKKFLYSVRFLRRSCPASHPKRQDYFNRLIMTSRCR